MTLSLREIPWRPTVMYAKYAALSLSRYLNFEFSKAPGPVSLGAQLAATSKSLAIVIARKQWYESVTINTESNFAFFICATYALVLSKVSRPFGIA